MVRIIAGELGGRRLRVPRGATIRPTAERVREALFSILGAAVAGAEVLDAWAGTGALGFEAASRGARAVTFVEVDSGAARAIADHVRSFGLEERCRVVQRRTLDWLRGDRPRGPWDLVLADPPWESPEVPAFLELVAPRLTPGGRVVVERSARRAPPPVPEPLRLLDSRRYGDTALDLFGRTPGEIPRPPLG